MLRLVHCDVWAVLWRWSVDGGGTALCKGLLLRWLASDSVPTMPRGTVRPDCWSKRMYEAVHPGGAACRGGGGV